MREAMQQALDALENLDGTEFPEQTKAIAALRAALAEQPTMNERIRADMTASRESFYKRADELLDERIAAAKLAEQPAPVPTSFEDWWFKESTLDALEKNLTVEQECRLVWDAAIAAAIPPGHCVVKDEPVARMLTWRGPSHTPTPPRAARTYAEFPEDAALPANKEAYWENAEPLYAARPGGRG